ncbi:MAG: hypothetical protein J6M55_00880 [Paludibacteraceae bacterium]|nr:hypothetical protein [Paludibacteraceae bacterium]
MKNKSTILLAVLLFGTLVFSLLGCKKDKEKEMEPAAFTASDIAGLWSAVQEGAYEETELGYYFLLNADATYEYFEVRDKGEFFYENGSFAITRRTVAFNKKKSGRSFFRINGIDYYVGDYKNEEWKSDFLQIVLSSVSNDRIQLERGSGVGAHLQKITALPAEWNSEYSEPEMTPTESLLVAQWDLTSKFQISGVNTQYVTARSPEELGIVLQPDGAIGFGVFLANEVWTDQNQAGKVGDEEHVTIYREDVRWTLAEGKLSLYCNGYDVYGLDESSEKINSRHVTLTTPLRLDYQIVTFTQHWLVLYRQTGDMYFAFHRSANPYTAPRKMSVSAAPKTVFATSKVSAKKAFRR